MTAVGWVVLVVVVVAAAIGTVLFVLVARRFVDDDADPPRLTDLGKQLPPELVEQVRVELERRR